MRRPTSRTPPTSSRRVGNYSEKILQEWKPHITTEATIHDRLAQHGLSLEERDAWWDTPLPEMGDRPPKRLWETDPVLVKMAATWGWIGDRRRFSILTPHELWPEEVLAKCDFSVPEPELATPKIGTYDADPEPEPEESIFTQEPVVHVARPVEPSPDPIFDQPRDPVGPQQPGPEGTEPDVPEWWS